MAISEGLPQKAEKLRALHRRGHPVVLVNAWDVATARIFEKAGLEAVATTSAGIAFASGYPDGQKISRERMLEAVARICAAVSVPVTADMEAGYGDTPEEIDRAAVGVLEAGRRHGVPIVLNARTDVYLSRVGPETGRLAETIRRGRAYRDAGADCVFIPGVTDPAVIGALVKQLACPVNVLAVAGSPTIADLARLGVARVSLGSGPMRAAMTQMQRLAEEVLTQGTYSTLEGITSHATMNDLMINVSPRRSDSSNS